MKQVKFSMHRSGTIFTVLFITMFLVFSTGLKAQSPTNFSGKWEFDKSKSDKDENGDASFDGKIILQIRQGSDTISFANTYIMPGKPAFNTHPDLYLLNGKVTADNSGSDPAKKFVKWSPDKKNLITNFIMTAVVDGASMDFVIMDTYKLSSDGKTLTIEDLHRSKIGGEKTVKKVYNKKV
jgi:hypothetical protein